MGAERWKGFYRLCRFANIPTAWTNTLAGASLSGAPLCSRGVAFLLAAFSCHFMARYILNDAFDADLDARDRPWRPIPSGMVSRKEAFFAGFALLGLGTLMIWRQAGVFSGRTNWPCVVASAGLTASIVFYESGDHKHGLIFPFVLAATRSLAYISAAFALSECPWRILWFGALTILLYLCGLYYLCQHSLIAGEALSLWPLPLLFAPLAWSRQFLSRGRGAALMYCLFVAWACYMAYCWVSRRHGLIRRGVVGSLAAMSLVDALMIALAAGAAPAALAAGGFCLTVLLQRFLPASYYRDAWRTRSA